MASPAAASVDAKPSVSSAATTKAIAENKAMIEKAAQKLVIEKEAHKAAHAIAVQMKKDMNMESNEMNQKKTKMKEDLVVTQSACEKEAAPECNEDAMKFKTENKDEADVEQEAQKLLNKCLKEAKWDCKKKSLAHMTEKYDQASTKLLKVKKDLGPWLKEQSKEKKEKDKQKYSAVEIKEKAKNKAAEIVASGEYQGKEMRQLTKGCKNHWDNKHCDVISDHCGQHRAFRFMCQLTCAACGEQFEFVRPNDGREIAYRRIATEALPNENSAQTTVHSLSPEYFS